MAEKSEELCNEEEEDLIQKTIEHLKIENDQKIVKDTFEVRGKVRISTFLRTSYKNGIFILLL